jgi:hypothetical protein
MRSEVGAGHREPRQSGWQPRPDLVVGDVLADGDGADGAADQQSDGSGRGDERAAAGDGGRLGLPWVTRIG